MRSLRQWFGLTFLATALLVGAASADPAPIVYAGESGARSMQTASAEPLAGGDERSYGYGDQGERRPGAIIDIRSRRQPAGQAEAPVSTERPLWLEQERVGPPYQANGRWYVPTPEPGYEQTGEASWYGPDFHGRATASGETYDQNAMTAAHPTLPLQSLVQVTNLENGREVIVRINDRGPFVDERLIDLSRAAADVLGFAAQGRARVHVRYLGPAPRRVHADNTPASSPPPALAASAELDGPVSLLPAVDAAAPQAASPPWGQEIALQAAGDYVVQVGAFSDLNNAHRVRDAVSSAGPVSVDVRRSSSGAELFRVRVGPWASAVEAEEARRTLAALGYADAIVTAR